MPPPGYQPGYPPTYPPAYGNPGYGNPSFYVPPNPYGYPRDHPRAGLALGLALGGIIGGFFTAGLAFALSPFAWFFGQKARSEIKKSNGVYHAEGNATAGMVLGIIGTVLLVLAILLWILVIAYGIRSSQTDSGTNALAALRLLTAHS